MNPLQLSGDGLGGRAGGAVRRLPLPMLLLISPHFCSSGKVDFGGGAPSLIGGGELIRLQALLALSSSAL